MDFQKLRDLSHRTIDGGELAEFVFKNFTEEKDIHAKVDVFYLVRKLQAVYVPLDLEGIDGVYINSNENSRAFIGLNSKKNIRRLKFTVAHELCHHIKDFKSENHFTLSDTSGKKTPYNSLETFANSFAAELLMPYKLIKQKLRELNVNEVITNDELVELADFFEVSLTAMKNRIDVFNISISSEKKLRRLDEKITYKIKLQYLNNLMHTEIFGIHDFREKCIKDIVANDSRFENVDMSITQISEFIFDRDNIDKSKLSKDEIEVLGLYNIHKFLLTDEGLPNQYSLIKYHGRLYEFAPYSTEGYRNSTAVISGSSLSTTPHDMIRQEMYHLFDEFESHLNKWTDNTDVNNFYLTSKMHQKLTKIHPFSDGNGRISRFLMNWTFKVNNYPFIIINEKRKNEYLDCMYQADNNEFKNLTCLIIDGLYDTINNFIIKYAG